MTETKRPDGSTGYVIAIISVCIYVFYSLAVIEANTYVQGVVVVDDTYVHYNNNNYRGETSYSIGNDPTQPRVLLCRVYSSQYARCIKAIKATSVAPLSDFDALVLEKLYQAEVLNRKPTPSNTLTKRRCHEKHTVV